MEYDRSLIEHSLKIWGFDIEKQEIEKIQHVPMHQWRISTIEKPLLYVDNLQCCIGLYAYGNNFAFAAHINTVVFDEDEYILDKNKNPIYCNRCSDLYNAILKQENMISEPFKVGIAIGCTPLNNSEKSMVLIYEGIETLIEKLKSLGIPIIQIENIYASEFIINSFDSNITFANESKSKKI